MQSMRVFSLVVVAVVALSAVSAADAEKKHHRHHKHHTSASHNGTASSTVHSLHTSGNGTAANNATGAILSKMKKLEEALTASEQKAQEVTKGKIEVNGPLPADFSERFVQAAARAAGINPSMFEVLSVEPLGEKGDLAEVIFQAPKKVVMSLEHQAADPDSKFAHSQLRSFLIARDADDAASASLLAVASKAPQAEEGGAGNIDIDTEMPYGELEPFGREDTAQELTESSVKESDEMVDQLERAEVAEEKRAVFRALTRLRGAAITSFDGVARSQTGNIDEYNKVHKWRNTHPLHHLADEESDISKWAFPDNADF